MQNQTVVFGAGMGFTSQYIQLPANPRRARLHANIHWNGFFHKDYFSFHAVPHCTSRQLQKFIVAGTARGVFNGRIVVSQGAQGTEASQSSRNLLLNEGARMYAKPQLEIYADDVKCGHGATIGQLDADGMFYLQSRGLDPASAQNLLLTGFAADVMNRLTLPSLRRELPIRAMYYSGSPND